MSQFPELNVRTYVTFGSKAGVYFFSLDAARRLAVWGARRFYRLPYFEAQMKCEKRDGTVHYQSSRRGSRAAEFRGKYRQSGTVFHAAPGSLEHFLTERYCLYTVHRGNVYSCEIHHPPWPLQPADCDFEVNTMAQAAGIALPKVSPLLHFSERQEVLIWPLRRA